MLEKKNITDRIDPDYMIRIRRELHMHPECGFELPQTLALIRRELDALGIPYTEKYGKSCITAFINPDSDGFSIGLRADTDALTITETSNPPYKSQKEGFMHACGHDVHTAALLGTAKALNEVREQLPCKVVLLFQAAEEASGGALGMVEDGVTNEFDVIAACHVDNRFDCGTIRCGRDAIFAAIDGFKIEFHGKTAHAAYPQNAADAIAMGAKAYGDIQYAFARSFDPFALRVVNVGMFQGGTNANTVSDYCMLRGTVRTYDEEVREEIIEKLQKIALQAADLFGGTVEFTRSKGDVALRNDPTAAELLLRSAADTLGKENALELERPLMCAEDFIKYTKKKPAVYFFLGTGNDELGIRSMTHASDFDVDERSLQVAASVFCGFVYDLKEGIRK